MPALDEDEQREHEQLRAWHAQFLIELGVDRTLACEHASDVDPHEVARLIAKGCPPDLAVDIIRP